ncbi:hypothetical protein BD769DRAFT_1664814 [Suillus cothurnatus]|nr:hypothetical protein BD769DRAFT_1664814 [Suillus cothurnatus]
MTSLPFRAKHTPSHKFPSYSDYDTMEESNGAADCVLILVAIIFPPAAAAFISGCGCDLLVNYSVDFARIPSWTPRAELCFTRSGSYSSVPMFRSDVLGVAIDTLARETPAAAPQQSTPQPPGYSTTDQPSTPQPTTSTTRSEPVDAPPAAGKN